MNNFNAVGRITKPLEVKKSGAGKEYLHFTIAVKRKFGNGTDFIPCLAFGNLANNIHKFCAKGLNIGVVGRLQIESKQVNGNWTTEVTILVDDVTFVEKKQETSYLPEYTPAQLKELEKEQREEKTLTSFFNPFEQQEEEQEDLEEVEQETLETLDKHNPLDLNFTLPNEKEEKDAMELFNLDLDEELNEVE